MPKSVFVEKMPVQISEEIKQFCAEVVTGQNPVYVPVKPQAGAEESCCHPNVEEIVDDLGGSPVFGWIIWQSEALLHAEFHCNWMSPSGELVDITPKVDGETKILFLPDPTKKWEGRCIPSRRKARRNNSSLEAFVKLYGQIDEITSKSLSGQEFSSVDKIRYLKLMLEAGVLQHEIEGAWSNNLVRASQSIADRRADKKASRQRRKLQRRRK